MQTFETNNVFLDKKVKTQQQQNKKSNIKTVESGIEPGTSCTQSGCVTTAPPSQLRVSIVVKLFKDARSVSLYPYNRSQILQNVKYTK